MKSALKHLGNRAIDNRTRYGRALTEWRQGVCDDLGGRECVSVAQLQLIDTASRTKLLLDSVDNYLAELGGAIINKRDRKLFPIVQQRSAMADSLVRQLQAIGTERVIRRITSLSDLDD